MNDQYVPLSEQIAAREAMNKLPTAEERQAAYKAMADKGMFTNNRLELGRGYDRSSFIKLKDEKGRSRIEISVQADGNPKLNFLDEAGKVVYSLPEENKAGKK